MGLMFTNPSSEKGEWRKLPIIANEISVRIRKPLESGAFITTSISLFLLFQRSHGTADGIAIFFRIASLVDRIFNVPFVAGI